MDGWTSWSTYHADAQNAIIPPAAMDDLLPLFTNTDHSVAVLRHSVDIIKAAVQYVNPDQVPIPTADHPDFVILT